MLKKLLNIKKQIDLNDEYIMGKRKNIEDKKQIIKGEMDKWGKKQQKKNFP